MAAITASMVAELRAKTDAPMMECKKALTEADGDMERAEEILRVKLGSKAGKASSRVTAEGVVAVSASGNTAALVEVNCETDFVSKNDAFLAFTKACAQLIAAKNPASGRAFNNLGYALANAGQPAAALAAYDQALRLAPNDFTARFNRRALCRTLPPGHAEKRCDESYPRNSL